MKKNKVVYKGEVVSNKEEDSPKALDKLLSKVIKAQEVKDLILASAEKRLAIMEFWVVVSGLLSAAFFVGYYSLGNAWLFITGLVLLANSLFIAYKYWFARKDFINSGGEL